MPDKEFLSAATCSLILGTEEPNSSDQETTEDTTFVSLSLLKLAETNFLSPQEADQMDLEPLSTMSDSVEEGLTLFRMEVLKRDIVLVLDGESSEVS